MPTSYIFIAVDFQKEMLQRLKDQAQARRLPGAVRNFADDIRPIKTLWAAYKKGINYISDVRDLTPGTIEDLGLQELSLQPSDTVLVKGHSNAFSAPTLPDYLATNYPDVKDLVFAGTFTGDCIIQSMYGAQLKGYRCSAIPELLADSKEMEFEGPEGHKHHLAKWLGAKGVHPDFYTSEEFLHAAFGSAATSLRGEPGVQQAPRSALLR